MKKLKNSVPAAPPVRAPMGIGGTDRSLRELADATHRLTMRRARDLLPGKIETRRLVLRAPIRGDVPDLVRLADNKTIADKLMRLPHPYTRADAIGFVEIFAQRADGRTYAITLSDHLIGIVGFSFVEDGLPELGYWLGEPFWGNGYMTEAVRGLIDAALGKPGFDRIAARALADNVASLRVLEKLGFRRVRKGKSEAELSLGRPTVLLELERPRWM